MVTSIAYSQNEFITTWTTNNPGTSNNTSITIPTTGAGYNYDVDWNDDGVFDEFNITGDVTHDFTIVGTYTIRIQGSFPRIFFNNDGDRLKFVAIEQWGNIAWTSMNSAFWGAENMVYNATDTPDLSLVTDLSAMFKTTSLFDGNLNNWNVSNITNMSEMFRDALSFNSPLDLWNVINVTDMSMMFRAAISFNQDISGWDVDNVIDMSRMFFAATVFNQDISGWDVDNVTDMNTMFQNATAFNQNLGGWNISNVTSMFDMISNTGISVSNYDNILDGWAAQTVQPNIVLGASGLVYCRAEASRDILITTNGWTIIEDSKLTAVGFIR